MTLDRPSLKRRAVELIRSSQPKVIYAALLFVLLLVVVAALSGRLMGADYTREDIMRFYEYAAAGNYDHAVNYLESVTPPPSSYFIDSLLSLMIVIVRAGFIIFLLNTIRGVGACYGNLLDGFGHFLRIFLLNLLEGLFIALWSLLLVVPGIIAAYRYSMAIYILLDDPERSPMDCLRESKRLMHGHKWELFVLDLSFIGWLLLAAIPFVGYLVSVWTTPYIGMTRALYYVQLRGQDTAGRTDFTEAATPWQ